MARLCLSLLAAALLAPLAMGALLLSGCSDYVLSPSPTPPPAQEDPPLPTPSPWDNLDPGSLPEVNFAVVWHDVTGIEALDEANDQYPCRPGPALWSAVFDDARLSLLDVRGRVIADIALPEPLDPYEEAELHPIGAERFLLEARAAGSRTWYLWQVDALSGALDELMRWNADDDDSGALLADGTAPISFPRPFSHLHPAVIGDVLYVAIEQGGTTSPPPLDDVRLLAYDLSEPGLLLETWSMGELLPPEAKPTETTPRLTIKQLQAHDGQLLVQGFFTGPAWDGSDSGDAFRVYRWVYLPEQRALSWVLDLSSPTLDVLQRPVHRHGVVRAALLGDYDYEVPEPGLTLVRTQGEDLAIEPATHECVIPRVVLDETSPTVAYSVHDPDGEDDYGNELVVSHRGIDVLRFPRFSLGLAQRRAHIQSLILLE